MLIVSIKIAIVSSVIAYVYSEILMKPGELLSFWWRFLQWICTYEISTTKEVELPEEVAAIKGRSKETIRTTEKRTWLILKPLGGCSKCFAGQLSFWFYLFCFYQDYSLKIFIYQIFTSCLTILLTLVISKVLLRL